MADKEIKIMFPEQKLEALTFFMGQKNETIEAALTEYINKAYDRYVPAPVRQFMNRGNAGSQENAVNQGAASQPAGTDRTTDGGGPNTPGRRNQRTQQQPEGAARTNRRTQRNAQQPAEPDAVAGQSEEMQEDTQEQGQGMTMGM